MYVHVCTYKSSAAYSGSISGASRKHSAGSFTSTRSESCVRPRQMYRSSSSDSPMWCCATSARISPTVTYPSRGEVSAWLQNEQTQRQSAKQESHQD